MTDKYKSYLVLPELENTTLNGLYQALLLNGVSRAYAIIASFKEAGLTFREVWDLSDEGLRVQGVRNLKGDNLRHTNEAIETLIILSQLKKKST